MLSFISSAPLSLDSQRVLWIVTVNESNSLAFALNNAVSHVVAFPGDNLMMILLVNNESERETVASVFTRALINFFISHQTVLKATSCLTEIHTSLPSHTHFVVHVFNLATDTLSKASQVASLVQLTKPCLLILSENEGREVSDAVVGGRCGWEVPVHYVQ
ncbi:hypothetical protein HDU98_006540 [Podochytrium sp. JEL0797]|nr:hypothetical protein HDU98_006540 [Podochytrium sp. JEL0797]